LRYPRVQSSDDRFKALAFCRTELDYVDMIGPDRNKLEINDASELEISWDDTNNPCSFKLSEQKRYVYWRAIL
jgi:hypothetical protein